MIFTPFKTFFLKLLQRARPLGNGRRSCNSSSPEAYLFSRRALIPLRVTGPMRSVPLPRRTIGSRWSGCVNTFTPFAECTQRQPYSWVSSRAWSVTLGMSLLFHLLPPCRWACKIHGAPWASVLSPCGIPSEVANRLTLCNKFVALVNS